MFARGPLNNYYLELFGATSRVNVPSVAGEQQGRNVEMFLDFMLIAWPSLAAATDVIFAGSYPGFGWFEAAMPANASPLNYANARFGVSRNSSISYSEASRIYLGKRHVMVGADDGVAGEGAYAMLDGTALANDATPWTAANLEDPFDVKGSFDYNYDDFNTVYCKMRVYEAWVKVNGVLIMHHRPKPFMRGTTELTDLSQFGNDGAITVTETTDWRIIENYNEAPPLTLVGG